MLGHRNRIKYIFAPVACNFFL